MNERVEKIDAIISEILKELSKGIDVGEKRRLAEEGFDDAASSLDSYRQLQTISILTREINGESDRGAALFTSSYMEMRLGEALKAYLADDSKVFDRARGTGGPISTFSAKIDLAYLLGLISDVEMRSFHLVRKIRNDFAHSEVRLDFDTPSVASSCQELTRIDLPRLSNRAKYINAIIELLGDLERRRLRTKHVSVKIHSEKDGEVRDKAVIAFNEFIRDLSSKDTDILELIRQNIAEVVDDVLSNRNDANL